MRFKKLLIPIIIVFFVSSAGLTLVFAGGENGNKYGNKIGKIFKALLEQVANQEERITALEEQPPVAGAGAKVYDANGQYLGMLMGAGQVYIPTLKKLFCIDIIRDGSNTYEINEHNMDNLYFEGEFCTGTPYLNEHNSMGEPHHTKEYFILSFKFAPGEIKHYTAQYLAGPTNIICKSRYGTWAVGCEAYDCTLSQGALALQEVELPFNYPVALPLVFE